MRVPATADRVAPTARPIFRPDGSFVRMVGFDFETYLIAPGRLTPRAVCLSLWGIGTPPEYLSDVLSAPGMWFEQGAEVWSALLDRRHGCLALDLLLDDDCDEHDDEPILLIAQNAPFDCGVYVSNVEAMSAARTWADDPYDALARVFRAYDDGRIVDPSIREKLIELAHGTMPRKPRRGWYSLSGMVGRRFPGTNLETDKKADRCSKCEGKGKLKTQVPKANGVGTKTKLVPCGACASTGEGVLPWRMRFAELDGTAPEDFPPKARTYGVEDSQWAVLLVADQAGMPGTADCTIEGDPVVNADGSVVDDHPQTWADFALHLCAVHGMRTGYAEAVKFAADTETAVAEGQAIGVEHGFVRPGGSKIMKALGARVEAAYVAQGLAVPRTEKGAVKTDKTTIDGSADPVLLAWGESGEARTNSSKYVRFVFRGTAQAMTSRPNVLKRTGRTSWSEPPLHQPPKHGLFRECFEPRPGRVFCSVDWTAAELVALAQINHWLGHGSIMREQINAGSDLHSYFGSEIMGIPVDEFLLRRAQGDPDVADARHAAKQGNFGFGGGMGPDKFVATCLKNGVVLGTKTMSPREHAVALKATWLAAFPEMRAYFKRFSRLAGRSESGFTYRQFVSGRQRGDLSYTDGCNTGFQGLVADALKLAMILNARACYLRDGGVVAGLVEREHAFDGSRVIVEGPIFTGERSPLYGSRPVLSLHDETINELLRAKMHEAALAQTEIMRLALRYHCPDVQYPGDAADPTDERPSPCEPALSERWYKAAEPVWRDGSLVPWKRPESP